MWPIIALASAVLWGIVYALNAYLLKYVSAFSLEAILRVGLVAPALLMLFSNSVRSDISQIFKDKSLLLIVIAIVLLTVIANVLMFYAMKISGTPEATLVEISYPVFTIIFSAVIFRTGAISISTVVAGVLIASGVAIMVFSN